MNPAVQHSWLESLDVFVTWVSWWWWDGIIKPLLTQQRKKPDLEVRMVFVILFLCLWIYCSAVMADGPHRPILVPCARGCVTARWRRSALRASSLVGWRVKAARTPCWPALRAQGLVSFFIGGIKLQETSEEGLWLVKRSPACSQAGDRLESSLLAVEVTCAGRWEVGADGFTACGRRLVWGWAVKSLEMDRCVWHDRGGVMQRRVMWLCCHARKRAQAALRRHPNSEPRPLEPEWTVEVTQINCSLN